MRLNSAVDKQLASITDWGFSESGEKKTPFIWIDFQFDVIEGDNGEPLDIRAFLYLSEAAFDRTWKTLRIFGWDGVKLFDLDKENGPGNFYNLAGKKALLTTEMETYEGKLRCKVKWINDPNGKMALEPMGRNNIKALSEKLAAKAEILKASEKDGVPF